MLSAFLFISATGSIGYVGYRDNRMLVKDCSDEISGFNNGFLVFSGLVISETLSGFCRFIASFLLVYSLAFADLLFCFCRIFVYFC